MMVCAGGLEARKTEIVDDPVGAGGGELGVDVGGAQGEHRCAGGAAGANACGSVLYHHTLGGRKTQGCGAFEVRFGIGLAVGNVVGGDQMLREREISGADADFGEGARAGGDDGPALRRQGGEKLRRAGERDNVGDVFDFPSLHLPVFCLVVAIGEQFAHGGDAGAAVGEADDFFRVGEAVEDRPFGPAASYGGCRIYEDAIKIE